MKQIKQINNCKLETGTLGRKHPSELFLSKIADLITIYSKILRAGLVYFQSPPKFS